MIKLKNKVEIELMKEGGAKLAGIVAKLKTKASPGMTTKALNSLAESLIEKEGGKPSFKGYKSFPAAMCASVNETVVHGIPSSEKLKRGDILSLDLGFYYKGYHTDMATTFPIGDIDEKTQKLINVTKKSLDLGIENSKKGNRLGDIGGIIEEYVKKQGFIVVEGLCGHGIGEEVHEEPQILNTGKRGTGMEIKEGFVFCIEPMITTGNSEIYQEDNGIKTKNLSAHFEHTIAIVNGRAEIITTTDQ